MKLMVNHQTHYSYSENACNSIQYIKMIPQSSHHQYVHYWDISVPGERVLKKDAFNNLWITSSQRFDYQHLTIMAQGIVELHRGGNDSYQANLPLSLFLQPTYATLWDAHMLEFANQFVKMRSLKELIVLAEQILLRVAYCPDATTVQSTAKEAFYAGLGVCQDHAHLMIAMCRALNLPARYVSGYLYDKNAPHLASHAWAEVFLDKQWYCFDVSNQLFEPSSHIYVAIGRDYFDVAPVRGIREKGGVEKNAINSAGASLLNGMKTMTYCCALRLKDGLVFISDTRTNAGVDQISVFRKLYTFGKLKDRFIAIQTAGNLATTQAVIGHLRNQLELQEQPNLYTVNTMFEVAQLVGRTLRKVIEDVTEDTLEQSNYYCSLTVGGQIGESEHQLYNIYPQGNFICATKDTPFFQIGESKYGKPILDRALTYDMPLDEALRCSLLSFDSTLRSNVSVGLPLDVLVYHIDSLEMPKGKRVTQDDEYFQKISKQWSEILRAGLHEIPKPSDDYLE